MKMFAYARTNEDDGIIIKHISFKKESQIREKDIDELKTVCSNEIDTPQEEIGIFDTLEEAQKAIQGKDPSIRKQ